MLKSLIAALILATVAIAHESRAADLCVDAKNPWTCFGVLEFKIPMNGQDKTARMIRYANGEIMFEIEGAAGTQRALVVLPAGIEFFFGLQSKQDLDASRNPFAFIDQGFNAIIALLQKSFPDGPFSQSNASEGTATLEDNRVARVTLQRIDPQTVRFQAAADGQQIIFTGALKQGLIPPLPNNFSLKDWLSKEEGIKTLGAARKAKPKPSKK